MPGKARPYGAKHLGKTRSAIYRLRKEMTAKIVAHRFLADARNDNPLSLRGAAGDVGVSTSVIVTPRSRRRRGSLCTRIVTPRSRQRLRRGSLAGGSTVCRTNRDSHVGRAVLLRMTNTSCHVEQSETSGKYETCRMLKDRVEIVAYRFLADARNDITMEIANQEQWPLFRQNATDATL